jgi:putative spermidine/putrescine transport system permease protein
MSGRAPWLLLPFVVAVYVGLLAPLVVVIAISFGPSPTFAFPPTGFTLHWFAEFFASDSFVRSFFRVSLVVGVLAAALATVLGTAAAIGLVRFRFFGREALETFFLAPLLVPQILLGAALYLFYARLADRHHRPPHSDRAAHLPAAAYGMMAAAFRGGNDVCEWPAL